MAQFILDERLKSDTHHVASLDICELRLMDDARWLWLILVPCVENAVEWHELFTDQRQDIDMEIANVASGLKGLTSCEKVNIASIGNVVRQLHIHVIARSKGDDNWPGPVWGFGERKPYSEDARTMIIQTVRETLGLS